jgi:uncharacterized membrane protein YqaE (UPF0057 family)
MIKKLHINIISILMVGLMFSCSTSNDVASNRGIQKRKYNKGFYVQKGPKLGGDTKQTELVENENIYEENAVVADANNVRISSTPEVVFVEAVEASVVESTPETNGQDRAEVAFNDTPNTTTAQQNIVVEGAETTSLPIQKFNKRGTTFMKKGFLKRVKKQLKDNNSSKNDAILYYILAFFIPFLAVGLVTNWDMKKVVINILLTLLCGIPGIIHAFFVVSRNV